MFISIKLYSKLFLNEFYEITTSYEVWKDVSYNYMNNILMISTDIYVQIKDSEHKKTDKTDIQTVKTVLVEFQNFLIYWLYDQKKNEIIISSNVLFNKNFMSDSLEKINDTIVRETKLIEFSVRASSSSVIISMSIMMKDEVSETDDLTVKSTVKLTVKLIISISLKITISTLNSLSVRVVSKIFVPEKSKKSCDYLKKLFLMNLIVKQAQNNLIWVDLVLAYSESHKSATKLTDALLALQNETLFNDSDI